MNVREIRNAWERFVSDGGVSAGVRSDIIASWNRSKTHGVNVGSSGAPVLSEAELYRRRADNALLSAAARKAMERAAQTLSDASSMLILTDGSGHVIQTAGDRRTIEAGREVRLEEGGCWREDKIGTNAIGTAIAARAPVQIHASEHFCQEVQRWTCAASPIFHPLDRELLGIVDISGRPETFSTQNMALAISIADHMEDLISQTLRLHHSRILECYREKQRKWSNEDLVAIDRRGGIVQCSAGALKRLADHLGGEPENGDLKCLSSLPFETWPDDFARRITNAKAILVRDGSEELGAVIVLPRSSAAVPAKAARKRRNLAAENVAPIDDDPVPRADARSGAKAAKLAATHPDGAKVLSRVGSIGFVVSDPVVKQICNNVAAAARIKIPILITGQTGTGKEELARHAHASSGRRGAFVPVNCASLPESLIEAELFGYSDGAFTGARKGGAPGLVRDAHGGTLFLDEIGDMPFALQAALLRFLDDSVVRPIGGVNSQVDVLVVSATNIDLGQAVTTRRFRADLLYRLNTIQVALPPLSERGDFDELVMFLLAKNHPGLRISDGAIASLSQYAWPGNIRELRSVLARVALLAQAMDGVIDEVVVALQALPRDGLGPEHGYSLRDAQRARVLAVYAETGGNISETARRLNVCRNTVYRALAGHSE